MFNNKLTVFGLEHLNPTVTQGLMDIVPIHSMDPLPGKVPQ